MLKLSKLILEANEKLRKAFEIKKTDLKVCLKKISINLLGQFVSLDTFFYKAINTLLLQELKLFLVNFLVFVYIPQY